MRSSLIAFIFAIFISSIGLLYTTYIITVKKGINKSSNFIHGRNESLKIIKEVERIINSDKHFTLKELESETITIKAEDLSSKIDLNTVDFTLFKKPQLLELLIKGITWVDLQKFRDNIGLVGDISLYRHLFKKDIPYRELFTIYSIPNINNSSDISLEKIFELHTGSSSQAENFKFMIQNSRLAHRTISKIDTRLENYITIIPSWNINYVSEIILKTLKVEKFISMRKQHWIESKEITEESLLSYLGDTTTFWGITVTNSQNSTKLTTVWGLWEDQYKLISIYFCMP